MLPGPSHCGRVAAPGAVLSVLLLRAAPPMEERAEKEEAAKKLPAPVEDLQRKTLLVPRVPRVFKLVVSGLLESAH